MLYYNIYRTLITKKDLWPKSLTVGEYYRYNTIFICKVLKTIFVWFTDESLI